MTTPSLISLTRPVCTSTWDEALEDIVCWAVETVGDTFITTADDLQTVLLISSNSRSDSILCSCDNVLMCLDIRKPIRTEQQIRTANTIAIHCTDQRKSTNRNQSHNDCRCVWTPLLVIGRFYSCGQQPFLLSANNWIAANVATTRLTISNLTTRASQLEKL